MERRSGVKIERFLLPEGDGYFKAGSYQYNVYAPNGDWTDTTNSMKAALEVAKAIEGTK